MLPHTTSSHTRKRKRSDAEIEEQLRFNKSLEDDSWLNENCMDLHLDDDLDDDLIIDNDPMIDDDLLFDDVSDDNLDDNLRRAKEVISEAVDKELGIYESPKKKRRIIDHHDRSKSMSSPHRHHTVPIDQPRRTVVPTIVPHTHTHTHTHHHPHTHSRSRSLSHSHPHPVPKPIRSTVPLTTTTTTRVRTRPLFGARRSAPIKPKSPTTKPSKPTDKIYADRLNPGKLAPFFCKKGAYKKCIIQPTKNKRFGISPSHAKDVMTAANIKKFHRLMKAARDSKKAKTNPNPKSKWKSSSMSTKSSTASTILRML